MRYMGDSETRTLPREGWFKSSLSSNGSCVEVRSDGDVVLIRDSKHRRRDDSHGARAGQPMIAVPANLWNMFLENASGRSVGFVGGLGDTEQRLPRIEQDPAGGAVVRSVDGTALAYTRAEWDAFRGGILAKEFDLV